VPTDIVICDWHYGKARDTPRFFAEKGFDVVACPWRNADVALAELGVIRAIRGGADKALAARALGMVQTTWCGFGPFLEACKAQTAGTPAANAPPAKGAAAEAARCFRTLAAAMRETGVTRNVLAVNVDAAIACVWLGICWPKLTTLVG
jgi:hypothetical protein